MDRPRRDSHQRNGITVRGLPQPTFATKSALNGHCRFTTLREAIAYLAKTVPKADRDLPAVTTAAEMLTYAAERGIAWMFMARIGVMRALHRNEVRHFNPDAKEHQWGKRKLKRDE
jgi:hypothetical protein